MVTQLNSVLLNAFFGQSGGVSADTLTAWASAKAGVGANTPVSRRDPDAPLAPVWTPGLSPAAEVLVQRALTNKPFFDTKAKLYADLGATGDYRRLFTLYSGLTTLQALAGRAEDEKLSATDRAKTLEQFARGLSEMQGFFAQEKFEDMRVAQADRVDAAQTTLALPAKTEDYVTGVIHRGGLYSAVSGLAPDAKFNIVATSAGGVVRNVAIDLAQMGSVPRTLSNVISHINGKLSAAGAASRLEAVDQTPKETSIVLGGRTITQRYTGPRQYALKVDVRASERVAFQPVAAAPAFYVVGDVNGGARLIKLTDVSDVAGQPVRLDRPDATSDPIGAHVAEGWSGGALEQRTNALTVSGDGSNKFEAALRAAGDAMLKLQFADGRTLSVSTAWRAGDQEAWRALGGQDSEAAMVGDLAERLTQLLHEQGVGARVEAWEDNGEHGLSVITDDQVRVSNLSVSGHAAALTNVDPPGMVGGLRDGVFARRFEAGAVGASNALFTGKQTFTFSTTSGSQTISIDGGEAGLNAALVVSQLNTQLRSKNIAAAASLVDNAGVLTLRFDALHSLQSISASLNDTDHELVLQAPGAWASGGLPASSSGQPFGDSIRTQTAASSPLLTHSGALDIELVVATPAGNKTISVSVSALERANDPDPAPGEWSATFKARLDKALNAAGVYVSASGDLTEWSAAEGAGHRIASLTINGGAVLLSGAQPAYALGGAFDASRSATSAQAATGVSDDVAALLGDQTVSLTFNTVWGERTVSATLQGGDPRTLESAALRLNEALAAQSYDVGVAAVALSGGRAGLRIVTGASHTVSNASAVTLGGQAHAVTLDPTDSQTHGANPPGALQAADRATRGAAVIATAAGGSTLIAPSNTPANWFPGRAFDVAVGGTAKVATAREVATGADGAVYVLADLSGDSATSAIKGARDVALLKYDNAGKLAFTQMLGASQSASGFALAVSADGKVAVAGSVEGALSGGGAARGGTDSFVTVFDADGGEVWTQRRGAAGNDEVRAIAFAPDGGVIIAGRTESALGPSLGAGGADGYVRGFSASGLETFTRQFGTGGEDAATALLVRDNGAGGVEIVTGGVENNRGVLRRFNYTSAAGLSVGATRDIGYFHGGAINALAADGASLYVGGEIGADRLTLGAAAHAAVAGKDGFVARLDIGLSSAGLDRASYLGSARDDAVRDLAVVDGVVYAAGVAGGVINGQGNAISASGFLARLDADGEPAWTRTFLASSGAVAVRGLAVDETGASPLDILGLPRGEVAAAGTGTLVERSALRVGDEFQVGADGRRLTTIRIGANDTLASLASVITRALGGAGRAQVVREGGAERLKITARDGAAVRLESGRDGRDALGGLGLKPGIVAVNATGRNVAPKAYGLGLVVADLKLDSKAAITATKAELSAAVSIVRQVYEALLNPNAKDLTDEEKALQARRDAAGVAPEYYTAQLANYKAALARLTGG